MKKVLIPYTLKETEARIVHIFKDGKREGSVVAGVASALEAIFVMENYTKKDWLIYEDEKVFIVDRKKYQKGEYSESI